MVKNIKIFDKLTFINLIKNLNNKSEIYYIKENLILKLINFFTKNNNIKKLEWKAIDLEIDNKKIITSIIENYEVDKFVYGYLDNLFRNKNLEKNFYHFLVKYFSNHKDLIGFMSVENFILLYRGANILFKNQNISFFLEENLFQDFINKKYSNLNNSFFFYKKYFKIQLLKKYLSLFKKLFFIFKNRDNKILLNKNVCVMDSYQINNPESFFSDREFFKKIIFITNDNKKVVQNSLNIYHYIDLKICIDLIYNLLKYRKSFKNFNLLNFLFIDYNFEKQIYYKFFKKNNIKIFLSAYIFQSFTSSAIAAIQDLKGKSIGFAMSFSEGYASQHNIDAFDYFISFNNNKYKFSQFANLKNIESLGYITDYKFFQKRNEAIELRESLKKNGAKYIIGFFDQGSLDDDMFTIGHNVSRSGYKFLLEKILNNKDFALIIKPKKPKLIKNKLGEVYEILKKTINTKRCIIFDNYYENHVKNFKDTPAKIAMASDITIHDTLLAGTAGLEAALVGTKSVFFDYYKSKNNQFEEKGLNIVFRDWNSLWEEIEKDYNKKSSINLGDWSQIIDKFDKFRDGKTNLRIIDFIKKLEK